MPPNVADNIYSVLSSSQDRLHLDRTAHAQLQELTDFCNEIKKYRRKKEEKKN
jgi:hypothetical protein